MPKARTSVPRPIFNCQASSHSEPEMASANAIATAGILGSKQRLHLSKAATGKTKLKFYNKHEQTN
jgi:hypothetical protein